MHQNSNSDVLKYKNLVHKIFWKFNRKYNNSLLSYQDDLMQEGLMGVDIALKEYDEKICKESTYVWSKAYWNMKNYIDEFILKEKAEKLDVSILDIICEKQYNILELLIRDENIIEYFNAFTGSKRQVEILKYKGCNNNEIALLLDMHKVSVSRIRNKEKNDGMENDKML